MSEWHADRALTFHSRPFEPFHEFGETPLSYRKFEHDGEWFVEGVWPPDA
jgi:hypothetical protein